MSVEKEIEALKFLLAYKPENEVERYKLIRGKVLENEYVRTYARFSETELKEQLRVLHYYGDE